ncbi:hypothetical protein, partial [Mesorhizobium sp. M2E.F.Ca.ET.166.01.1.1]|uniref:hypothetical protein n=1 Tax=Mesorhizobium sp. M2E.F.Ca.ET.166.01.1.1 TaxID=2500523 RepID=UPI001AEE89B3
MPILWLPEEERRRHKAWMSYGQPWSRGQQAGLRLAPNRHTDVQHTALTCLSEPNDFGQAFVIAVDCARWGQTAASTSRRRGFTPREFG